MHADGTANGDVEVRLLLDPGVADGYCQFVIRTHDGEEALLIEAFTLANGNVQYNFHHASKDDMLALLAEFPEPAIQQLNVGDSWDVSFSEYWYFLTHPWEMDDDLETTFYVAAGTVVVAGGAAGGIYAVGAMQAGGAGITFPTLTGGTVVNSTKLIHIFGKPLHGMGPVISSFGDDLAATFAQIEALTVSRLAVLGITSGLFETTIFIAVHRIVVQGTVINGVVKIGTAFLR